MRTPGVSLTGRNRDGFVDSGEGRQYRSETLRRPAGGIGCRAAASFANDAVRCARRHQVVLAGGSRPMDYSELDKVRRTTTPLQLDAVEAFARGRLSRREFIQRGTVRRPVDGLDQRRHRRLRRHQHQSAAPARPAARVPRPSAAGASASGRRRHAGGTIRVACQRPAGPLDPVAMIDLASYGITAQSFEFLCTLAPNATDIAPGLAESGRRTPDNKVWTFKLRQGVKWQDGKDFTSADVVATMERLVAAGNSGIKGVIDKGSAVATDPNTVTFNAGQRQRQLPVPRLGVQRPVADHPGRLRRRARRSTRAQRDRAWKLTKLRHRVGRQVRPQRHVVGRQDAARRHRIHLLR